MAVFIPDPSFLQLLQRSADVADMTMEVAEAIANEARSNGPQRSGSYVQGVETERVEVDGATGARVMANDRTGAGSLVEFGSVNNPAYAPLRRGADAVTGNLREDRQ